ncbi:hypothetical protein LWC34_46820 [Kibdelosporangium philippinense]|uniref:ABC transporter permease n=1 Tax=Kibdelosporangium philippinense TaxID=211113 RepID=A0ABS8ZTF1_9PSEU|nr:hypothetical protein [Kibdelosporangium philippinense]MCE7010270.1 hypothetical protein [Kibdelosporangium philippinense]
MIRVLLLSRGIPLVILAAALIAGVSAVIGSHVIDIEFSPVNPNRIPVAELCAIVSATITAVLMRPRFWEWDRGSIGMRARVIAVVSSAVGITLPMACVLVLVPGLPDFVPWVWVLTNAFVLVAVVQVLAPFIGALSAGVTAVLLWLSFGLLHNVKPDLAWLLPTSSYAERTPDWLAAGILIVLALLVHARTLGRAR